MELLQVGSFLGKGKLRKSVLLVIFLVLILGTIFCSPLSREKEVYQDLTQNMLNESGSTNPSSPTSLSDDGYIYESYSASTNYYYRTSTASSSYYHVIWVQPTSTADNFDLYLYSDSGYSTLRTSSGRGDGYLDWVVFRPSSSTYYYPRVYTYDVGNAYIEWEDGSSSISYGGSYGVPVSSSECVELYRVSLSSSNTYSFTLDVPSTGDYDLYLYYLSYGSYTSYTGYTRASAATGAGYDETISGFNPYYTGDYAIIVTWKSGSGTPYLSYSYSSGSYTSLADDSADYEYYDTSSTYYYYRTGTAYSSYYHVVWLQPVDSNDDFDLRLYSDSSYYYQQATSMRGSGLLDWVVFRPSSSQYYYPVVQRSSGTGYAYIEWEDSSYSLSMGGSYSGSLSSSECIEIYEVDLNKNKKYDFDLSVPSSCDFDLYLYRLSSGYATSYSGYAKGSASSSLGADEKISGYKPSYSDSYAVVVVRKSGSGSYTLKVDDVSVLNPGIVALIIFGVIAVIGISVAVYKNYRPQQTTPRRDVRPSPTLYRPQIKQTVYNQPPVVLKKPITNYIFCPYCGSKRVKIELFCKNCGSELDF